MCRLGRRRLRGRCGWGFGGVSGWCMLSDEEGEE